MRSKNDQYDAIGERLSQNFDVVGYTHGGAISKDGKEAIILNKKP